MTMTEERSEAMKWQPVATVRKWHDTADFEAGAEPDEVVTAEGNLLLNAGITRLLNLLVAAGGQGYDATHCRVAVGDSSTAASASQTDLQAVTNKYYKLVDSVTVSGQTVTIVATFGTSDGNFAWLEWGIDVGTASGSTVTAPMLNRKVASLGTKASGSTWTFSVTITIS